MNKPEFTNDPIEIDLIPDKESCVSCGIKTDVPKSLHIDQRKHYVEGAGQLCVECFNKIYKK